MSTGLQGDAHINQSPISVLPETKLLKYFAALPEARLIENKCTLLEKPYYLFEAGLGEFVGTGRDSTRVLGCIKAIAECLERKVVYEAFCGSLASTPKWKQTSNGFALHFNLGDARQSARREAMERHILQMTYFKDGWEGFQFLDEILDVESGLKLTRIVSRYRCGDYRAGMVIARSEKFSGISPGYICDYELDFAFSKRWDHASYEAVDKIEPMLRIAKNGLPENLKSIDRAMFDWLLGPPLEMTFAKSLTVLDLPLVNIVFQDFHLSSTWNLDFPLFASIATGENLMPMLVPERIFAADKIVVQNLLSDLGLPSQIPARNPIL